MPVHALSVIEHNVFVKMNTVFVKVQIQSLIIKNPPANTKTCILFYIVLYDFLYKVRYGYYGMLGFCDLTWAILSTTISNMFTISYILINFWKGYFMLF